MMRRFVDLSVSLGCAVGIAPSALGAMPLPGSISETMPDPYAMWWAFVLFIACTAIVVGVLIRRRLPGLAFLLEYPGTITAAIMTVVYGAALAIRYGIGATWLATGFTLAVSLYFTARFLELVVSRRRVTRPNR
jgi:hypothetical protein